MGRGGAPLQRLVHDLGSLPVNGNGIARTVAHRPTTQCRRVCLYFLEALAAIWDREVTPALPRSPGRGAPATAPRLDPLKPGADGN